LVFAVIGLSQSDIVNNDGIKAPVHQANIGKIVFTAKPAAAGTIQEGDFLKSAELNASGGLAMTAFTANSLTNYLHRLAPELSADDLVRNGNYQFAFYVDGILVHTENLNPAWIPADSKNSKTIYSATLINPANPDSRWGVIWQMFLISGGAQALTPGKHLLKLEMRPYLTSNGLKVGDVIAAGELSMNVPGIKIDENLVEIWPIKDAEGWELSKDTYNKEKIRDLNRRIAEGVYKDIKSIVVIKNGKLLIEEYFNGADRQLLQNTRSVGKSFTSALMGIAINEGYIKSESQTLSEFYDLRKFANYSSKKEGVTLKSLLTLSSGFDANDDDPDSPGNEAKMYPTSDYTKFALDLSMDNKTIVGEKWRYFTAGVNVLSDILNKSVPGGLEQYANAKLFKPLGISKHEWDYTPQRIVFGGGGLQLTALDFARFGQLYKGGGRWNGRQVIPRDWVTKSFTKYLNVPYGPKVFYGYLFWNMTYTVGDKPYETFFATGNGGNKIFIFKDQPLVVVITATAFGKWYMHRQVDSMMERFILPAVVN
jgi:CubicO group peptidase (beta-lactamase class C family)